MQESSTVVECISALGRPWLHPQYRKTKKTHKQTENQTSCAWADYRPSPLFLLIIRIKTSSDTKQTAQSWSPLGRLKARTVTLVPPGTNEFKLQIIGAFAAYKLPSPWNLPSQLQSTRETVMLTSEPEPSCIHTATRSVVFPLSCH